MSGTFVAGDTILAANTNPASAATTGTDLAVVNAKLSAGAGVLRPLHTTTLPEVPTLVRPIFNIHLWTGATTDTGDRDLVPIEGGIIIPPGCCISIISQMGGAGSSPLLAYGMMWAEVPA